MTKISQNRYHVFYGSKKIAPPTLKPTLNQTFTLTGGQVSL